MRRYETIAIIDPDLSDEERDGVLDRLTDLIPKEGGVLIKLDEWGTKKLAYEINKKARGYYLCIDYCGTGNLVDEMERLFRIDDRVLKYMTVLLEKDADIERIKEEMEEESEADMRKEDYESDVDQLPPDNLETEAVETETAETEAIETQSAETETAETEAIETQSAETEAAETEAIETQSAETEAIETEAAEPEKTTEPKISEEEI